MAQTTDGCSVTTVDQMGDYAGQEVGRVWLQHTPAQWVWWQCDTCLEADALVEKAQQLTAAAFAALMDTE